MRRLRLFFLLLVLPSLTAAQMPHAPGSVLNTYDLRYWLQIARFTHIVTVDPTRGRGDFVTIDAAVDYVRTQSPAAESPWTIVNYGGDHSSEEFELPDHVSILSAGAWDGDGEYSALGIFSGAQQTAGLKVRSANVGVQAVANGGWGVYAASLIEGSAPGLGTPFEGGGVRGQAMSPAAVALDALASEGAAGLNVDAEGGGIAARITTGGEGSASPVVEIRRESATGNATGDVLLIVDLPITAGTKSGDLIAARSNSGGSEVEKFAIGRDGAVRLAGGCKILTGSGSPESVIAAPVCSLFLRTDGGTSSTLYVKTSGSGNTGWTAK
jgi:hypothetical protein